ncbi:MAG: ArsR/SmtB family transcription factor [Sandaracinaceae bacterium]
MSEAAPVDRALRALAVPQRRAIVDSLRDGPRSPGELAAALSINPPAMSKHLRALRGAGLVEQELSSEDARVRVVRLRREPFDALRAWLDEVEAFWGEQLDAFRAHAEATMRVDPSAPRKRSKKARR